MPQETDKYLNDRSFELKKQLRDIDIFICGQSTVWNYSFMFHSWSLIFSWYQLNVRLITDQTFNWNGRILDRNVKIEKKQSMHIWEWLFKKRYFLFFTEVLLFTLEYTIS